METQKKVPFISEVELFNETFGKLNNYEPTIPAKKDSDFVYNFILEELNELKEATEAKDIISVADALGDIMYVLCNGILTYGLKDRFELIYKEIQFSNMTKCCKTIEEAEETVKVRSEEQGKPCHYEKIKDLYIVYRTEDRKAIKSVNYLRPDLQQFFTDEELKNIADA